MQMKLLRMLACPKCFSELSCSSQAIGVDEEIVTGVLQCGECRQQYPIERGIPRFVDANNYASSFGYQWNCFKSEQIDAVNGTRLSEKRFYSETEWTADWMSRKWILEVGCGAGRFLDVASQNDCEVVGVDMSNATDAARVTLSGRKNVHLVQASVYELPFRSGVFDGCYCIGVIQHTPDPERSLRALPRVLKEGGRLAVTIYERKPWTKLNAKYLIRPITKRLNKKALLYTIKGLMPVLFPVTEVVFRIPYLGRLFMHAIPVANYVNERELTIRQRYDWAVLDTFDMLAPRYDQPQSEYDVAAALRAEGIEEIRRLNSGGVNLVGQKCKKSSQ
jgi:SAM-dependent methyltransferase